MNVLFSLVTLGSLLWKKRQLWLSHRTHGCSDLFFLHFVGFDLLIFYWGLFHERYWPLFLFVVICSYDFGIRIILYPTSDIQFTWLYNFRYCPRVYECCMLFVFSFIFFSLHFSLRRFCGPIIKLTDYFLVRPVYCWYYQSIL